VSLAPQSHIDDAEREAGLQNMVKEAAYSSGTTALTSGVILTALALHLGASNLMIGLLASAPFLSQLLQGPAIIMVERLRARKRIAVLSSVIGRVMLFLMGLSSFLPAPFAIAAVVVGQCVLCGFGAIGGCAWNSWVRDLTPESVMGKIFARRTIRATAVSLAAGLFAAVALDQTPSESDLRSLAFLGLYALGGLAGLWSAIIVARIPEPAMPESSDGPISLIKLIRRPLRDHNFRRLIVFLSSWQFAVNLATPFFTVYMVNQLGLDMTFVVILSITSQIANIATLRAWGTFTDRFANKSVLLIAAPAYILSIVAMILAPNFTPTGLHVYLVVLHLLMGASVAGVTLATTNIALKLSPRGSATAYVATNALVTSLAAGLAPILGGAFADFFSARRLELLIRWTSPDNVILLTPLRLAHWEFYFLLAGLLGLFALHRLSLVNEEGEIKRSEMMQQVLDETFRTVRNVSSVAGLRAATVVPAGLIREARVRARYLRARHRKAVREAARATRRPRPQPGS